MSVTHIYHCDLCNESRDISLLVGWNGKAYPAEKAERHICKGCIEHFQAAFAQFALPKFAEQPVDPNHHIRLNLSCYHASNLRWLLLLAVANYDGEDRKAVNLHTGDWTAELLWELEDLMIKRGWDKHYAPNQPDPVGLVRSFKGWGR